MFKYHVPGEMQVLLILRLCVPSVGDVEVSMWNDENHVICCYQLIRFTCLIYFKKLMRKTQYFWSCSPWIMQPKRVVCHWNHPMQIYNTFIFSRKFKPYAPLSKIVFISYTWHVFWLTTFQSRFIFLTVISTLWSQEIQSCPCVRKTH